MSRFQKWAVWVTSFLTVATGVAYFAAKYLAEGGDGYSVVNHPWQPWLLKAHIVVSPMLIFALGLIAVDHVWDHIVSGVRVSRRTALVTVATVVPMILTGYLIQVLTASGWVTAMAIAHIAFGALYAVGLAAHNAIIWWKGLGGSGVGRGR